MSQIALLDFQAARYLMTGKPPGQAGNDHPTSMPTSAYKTKDGYMNIAATGEGMWRRVCEGIGRKDLLEREDFKGDQNRSKNRAALNAEIGKALAARTTAEWIEILTKAEVPCGPIYGIDQMFEDPQVQAHRSRGEREEPEAGGHPHRQPGGEALAHARAHGGGAARSRRAHRGDTQGPRLRRGGDRRLEAAKGGLATGGLPWDWDRPSPSSSRLFSRPSSRPSSGRRYRSS